MITRIKNKIATESKRCFLIAALAGMALFLILVASAKGPGLSPDSIAYASATHSLINNGSANLYDGKPMTIFPPGLPVILSLSKYIGIGVEQFAVLLNALCLAGSIILAYLLSSLILNSNALAFAVASLFSLSLATTQVFSMLWTEPAL